MSRKLAVAPGARLSRTASVWTRFPSPNRSGSTKTAGPAAERQAHSHSLPGRASPQAHRATACRPRRACATCARDCTESAQGAGEDGRSVGGRWYKLGRAPGAARREPPPHRAGRAAPRSGPERAHRRDRRGQDGARPRARPAARRPRPPRDRAPGGRGGLRRGGLRAAGGAARRAGRAAARRRGGGRARPARERRGAHAGLPVRALRGGRRPARGRGRAAVVLRPARAPQAHARLLAAGDPRRLLRRGAPGASCAVRGDLCAGARARGDAGRAARARRGPRARARPARVRAAGDRGSRSLGGRGGRAARGARAPAPPRGAARSRAERRAGGGA